MTKTQSVLTLFAAFCLVFVKGRIRDPTDASLWAGATESERPPANFTTRVELVAKCQSKFGMDMYQHLASVDNFTNIFFSPVSVATALAMVYAGSTGQTAEQMAAVLHYDGEKRDIMHGHRVMLRRLQNSKTGVTTKITNNVYVADYLQLRSKFAQYMARMFSSEITPIDFTQSSEAASFINERVRQDTEGLIDGLVEPQMLHHRTLFLLANAIYFKGDWLMKFNKSDTAPGQFHSLEGPRQVDMMTAEKQFPSIILPELKARALLLPYQGEKVAMVVLLPDQLDGIHQMESMLNSDTLAYVADHAQPEVLDLLVQMPKFKMEEKIDLEPVLTEMGMTDLFDESLADLSGITGTHQAYISDAVHRAVVEVNEEGTEAAGVTGFLCCDRSVPTKPEPFIVDHPFFFAIVDVKLKAVLFAGRVMELGSSDGAEPPLL